VRRRHFSFFARNQQARGLMKILIVEACMLNALIEYPFCGIHSPRDVIK